MGARIILRPGSQRAIMSIKNLKERNARGINQAFYKIGKDLKSTANRLLLEKPKSGKVYRVRRGSQIIRHVASAPGEAPANLTGDLRRSLGFNVIGSSRMEFGYREKFEGKTREKGAFYGKWLELGTKKIKPRPGLLLAIKKNQRNAEGHFNTELAKELNR